MKVSFVRPAQLPPELSIIFQLGHVIGLAGGCTDTVTGAIESTWKAFYELLAILTKVYLWKSISGLCQKCSSVCK